MTGRRGMAASLAVIVLGAVLVLVTSGKPRWAVGGTGLSDSHAPATSALALVALAGAGLLLLLRGPARSVVGALVALIGAGIVVADVRASKGGGWTAFTPLPQTAEVGRTSSFWICVAGGVLVLAGGLAVAVWGSRWPGARRSYRTDRPAEPGPADAWTALDRGEDPTA